MSDQPSNEDSISGELRKLGENFRLAFDSYWNSEERKRITGGLDQGFADLRDAFDEVAENINQSETTQKVREEVTEVKQRISSGKLEEQMRSDILDTLRRVNQELDQFSSRWQNTPSKDDESTVQGGQSAYDNSND